MDLKLIALHSIGWNKNQNIHTEPAEVECESALTILFSGYFFKPPVKTKTRIKNTLLHLFRQANNTDCQTSQTSVTTRLSCFVFYPRALCDHLRFNTARLIVYFCFLAEKMSHLTVACKYILHSVVMLKNWSFKWLIGSFTDWSRPETLSLL